MMKSFFKKLAFVMALAMVVTTAAPAANVFAATTLKIAEQTTGKVCETYEVAVGETVDFKFYGAPSNWAKLGFTWTSSDENVLTVDPAQDGKVTGVADGVAVVTVASADGEYVGEVVVTVGTGVVPPAIITYTATQKSEITFDVNFSAPVEYGRDDVQLFRIFDTDEGPAYVVWAVQKAKLSDDGMTLTVEPYVQFGDGDKYLVKVGENTEGYEFTTHLGEITHVTFEWVSAEKKYVAYTAGEDADADIEIALKAKLWSGTVDLTKYYKNEGYVEFNVLDESDPDYYSIADDVLVITKAGEWVKVQAVYVYEDATGEEKKAYSDAELIQAVQIPDYAVDYIVDWSIVGKTAKVDWKKPVKTIAAGKEGYEVAVLVKDNRGKVWSSHIYKDNDDIDGIFGENCADDTAEHVDMFLQFYSTNTDKFLVDTDGTLKTYTQLKNAVVYVALHDNGRLEEDYETTFVRNIGAFAMEIGKPSQLDELVLTTENWSTTYSDVSYSALNNVSLVTDAVDDLAVVGQDAFINMLTQKTLYLWNLDQYGIRYDVNEDKVVTNTTMGYTVSSSNKDVKEYLEDLDTCTFLSIHDNNNGTASVKIDALELNSLTQKSSVTFVINATQYDKTMKVIDTAKVTLKVSLKDPDLYDEEDTEANLIPTNREEGDVKVTGWSLTAGDAGLDATKGSSYAKIEIPMLSKSYTVGFYNRYDMDTLQGEDGGAIEIVTNAANYEFKSGAIEEPGIYVLVVGPDGKAVSKATTTATGTGLGVWVDTNNYAVKVNVAADNNDNVLDYMATGKYTVKTTFVTSTPDANGKVEYKTRTDYFNVTDNIVRPVLTDMYEVETEYELDDTNPNMTTIKQIIRDNYWFTFDKNHDGDTADSGEYKWVPSMAEIAEVNYLVKGDYLLIKSITFRLSANVKGNDIAGKYYEYTLENINRSVKLGVEK